VAALHLLSLVAGTLLVISIGAHIFRTLVVPRSGWNRLFQLTDLVVGTAFRILASALRQYTAKDKALAQQDPAVLAAQLTIWLATFELGYSLLLWPESTSFPTAMREAASSIFTLGFAWTN
jgi:hypothetical protein